LIFSITGPNDGILFLGESKITTEPSGKGMLTLALHLWAQAGSGAFQRESNEQHHSGAISSIVPCLARRRMKNRFYECFTRIEVVEAEFWKLNRRNKLRQAEISNFGGL
jgi:hypothetical protein